MKRLMLVANILIVASMLLSACATPTPEVVEKVVTQVVKETVIVAGTPEVVEKVVTQVVKEEVVVTATPEPSVLRIGNTGDISFLDAQRVQSGYDLPHSDYLYSRLVLYDPTMMNPNPDVAESWTVSDDGMTWVFKLRQDVKFHTGRGLTAEDVVYSWDRSINEIGDKGRGKGELNDVVSYEATGTYELTVKINKISPVFLPSMGHWALAIVDKETIDQIDTHPIGTGPYKFVELIPEDRLVLEKFSDYYDKEALARWPDRIVIMPYLEEQTRLAALKAGEIDLAANVSGYQFLDDIRNTPGLHLIEQRNGLSAAYMTVGFNLREGPTANKLVRQAVQYAIDKEAINKAVYFGVGEVGCNFIPGKHWAYEPIECPRRDIEKAKQLLAEAGYPDGLELSYIPENNAMCQKMAEVVKQSLAEAGIEIEITLVDTAQWLDQVWFGHDFEITDAGYSREPDPDGLMQSVLRKDKGNNVMGYHNPQIEDLFDAGKSTLDQAERKAIYKQIMEIVIWDDVPTIKIQTLPRFAAANYHIQNAYVSPKGYFSFKDYTFIP